MTVQGLFVGVGETRPTRVVLPGMLFKALGSDTDGAYSLCEFEATYDIPPHVHRREDEALYVLEGQILVRVGEQDYELRPGDFLFMPKGEPHAITCASPSPIRLLAISSPPGFEHFMEDLTEALSAGHDRSSQVVADIRERHGWVPVQ